MAVLWPARNLLFRVVPTAAAVIAAGCGIFVLAMTLRMVVLGWSPVPYSDQWDEIVSGRSLTWSWLFSQHSEHRLFVPRLIFWLDRWLAAETNVVDFLVNVLIQAALWGLLFWLAIRDTAADRTMKIWAGGVGLALLFWAVQYENFLWGFQVEFFAVVLFAASTFAMVALGPTTGFGAVAAALVSGAAVYTLAGGILVPGFGLMLGFWVGRPRWYLVVLLIAAIGWPASYLLGYHTPSYHSDPAAFFAHSGAVWRHFFIQLGAPIFLAVSSEPDLSVTAMLGAVGVALFGGGLVLLLLLRPARPQQKALATLSIFLLGGAFLIALGRVRFGPDQALSSRYSTPAVAFWLSTFLLWFSASAFMPRLRLLTLAVGALIAIGPATSESRLVEKGLEYALDRKLATPALLAGVDDPRLDNLFPEPATFVVLERRAGLLQFHTSVFAEEWTRLMGANFAEHFTVDRKARCSGSFRVQPIDEAASRWTAMGTAWREGSFEPLRQIVLATDDGRIVGYGLGGFDPSSVGEEMDLETSSGPVWWTGDIGPADPTKVRAYAVDNRGVACLIGSNPRVDRPIALAPLPSSAPTRSGFIDSITIDDKTITITGWGYLSREGQVKVDTDLPVKATTFKRQLRPDVVLAQQEPSLRDAGIEVRLFLLNSPGHKHSHRLCVWTDDPKYGPRLLNNNIGPTDGLPPISCGGERP